jgi:hypothetical protein
VELVTSKTTCNVSTLCIHLYQLIGFYPASMRFLLFFFVKITSVMFKNFFLVYFYPLKKKQKMVGGKNKLEKNS